MIDIPFNVNRIFKLCLFIIAITFGLLLLILIMHGLQCYIIPSPESQYYFSAIGMIGGYFVGIFGLILGYLYFSDKQIADIEQKRVEQSIEQLGLLRDELNKYNDIVLDIINNDYSDKKLNTLRDHLVCFLYFVQDLIKGSNDLFHFQNIDIQGLINVISFVDQNYYINRATSRQRASVSKRKSQEIKSQYLELFSGSMRVCNRKLRSLILME